MMTAPRYQISKNTYYPLLVFGMKPDSTRGHDQEQKMNMGSKLHHLLETAYSSL
jgi:hypothetical protein